MNIKRVTRLIKLLQELQAGAGDSPDGLAAACGVSRRTIFRDLETLKSAGVPIAFDKTSNQYALAGAHFLPPVNFTAAEALSLIAVAKQLGDEGRLPFLGPARAAALKLEGSLPAQLREELQTVARSIQFRINSFDPLTGKQEIYEQLVDAIAGRRVVVIQYGSLTEWETIRTRLRPYQLLFNRHSWYVVGRSTLHKGPRTFNLSRIDSLEPTRQTFARPRGFSVDRYLGNAWNLIPEPGPDHHVHLRFAPLVAHNVAEVRWHKTQQTAFRPDGSLDFHARVSGLNEIAWWVLGYGDQVEVLKTAKLRRLVAARVKNMHATYSATEDDSHDNS
ncbi:MAG: transcriptional regulator [Planctomycetales bacterium]|nr:transcriptional regulator [Planctomycetales bacterium]